MKSILFSLSPDSLPLTVFDHGHDDPKQTPEAIIATSSKLYLSNMLTPSPHPTAVTRKRHVYFPTSFLCSLPQPLTAEILFACAKAPYLPIITLHPSPSPAPGVTPLPGPPLDSRSQGAIMPRSPSDSLSALGVRVRGLWAEHCGPCESCPPKPEMPRSSDNVTFTSGKLNRKVG